MMSDDIQITMNMNDIDKLIEVGSMASSRSRRRSRSNKSSSYASSSSGDQSDIISITSEHEPKTFNIPNVMNNNFPSQVHVPTQSSTQGIMSGMLSGAMHGALGGDGSKYFPSHHQREQDIKEKQELLYQFNRLARKGVRLPSTFTLESDLNEMREEYERLMRDYDIDKSVAFQRKMVMATVTGIEFLNPFSTVKLEGWSEHVHDELNQYDDIFEELHDIYKGKAKIRPELRLLMSLAGSAIMFHLSNTLFKQCMPGLDQVLKQNPALMKQVMSAAMNTMTDNATDQQQAGKPGGGITAGLAKMMSAFMGNKPTSQAPAPPPPQQPKMRGPGFDDFNMRDDVNNIETFSVVDEDDGEVSLSNFSISSKRNKILNL